MKYYRLFLLLFFINASLYAQQNVWVAFWNADSTLVGYKDANGVIKIPPKFSSFSAPAYFDQIMAASEEINGKWMGYYLTKAGRVVARDSLYIFDNTADCESEGFIRFRDRQSDLAGMLNRQGDVAIPAIYNDLKQVNRGMIVALKGATKEVFEGGEHFAFHGGNFLLIDTLNHVLLDSFSADENLNLYSLQISATASADPDRVNFRSSDGRYFSFIHFEKEFSRWLSKVFLANLSKVNLTPFIFPEMAYWNDNKGWISEKSSSFIARNYTVLKSKLLQLKPKDSDYTVSGDGLNPFIFKSILFKKYYNNCNESMDARFPVRSVSLSNPERPDLLPDTFEFLRTEKGYKLISVSFGDGGMR